MLVQLGDKSVPEKRTENETPLSSRADESGRVISSPAHSKSHAKHIAKGKVKTASMKSIEAEAVTIGLPYLKARETVQIENVGKKFSGSWRITQVRHEISSSGYTCTMTLSKNDHEGSASSSKRKSGSAPKKSARAGKNNQAKPVQPAKAKPKTVKIDMKTGKVIE